MLGGMCGGGHAWQEGCVWQGGGMCGGGPCGGHMWWGVHDGGMHGMGGGHAWQGGHACHMVSERAVRIQLECILVAVNFDTGSISEEPVPFAIDQTSFLGQ